MIGRHAKSLEYELSEIFDDCVSLLKKSRAEIQKYSSENSVDKYDFGSAIDKELIKQKLKTKEILTKKEERFFWTCFFDFETSEIDNVLRNANLSEDSISRIVEKSWSPGLIGVTQNQFNHLNNKLVTPKFLEGNWVNLVSIEFLIYLSEKCGQQMLTAEFSSLPRSRALNSYLIGSFCYYHLEQIELEGYCAKLANSDFADLTILNSNEVTAAKALFISSHLKFYRENIDRKPFIDSFMSNLKMILGDPRSVPNGWGPVKEIEELGFDFWRKLLNEEDIVFFFDKLNKIHDNRKQFWLQYRRTADRIFLIVDKTTKLKLEKRYSSDEKQFSTISRLLTYRSEADKDQFLIVLVFRDYVVVEGSATGFGCQIFSKNFFLKKFRSSIFENSNSNTINESDYSSFRGASSGVLARLPNHDANDKWIESYREILAKEYNIKPDSEISADYSYSEKKPDAFKQNMPTPRNETNISSKNLLHFSYDENGYLKGSSPAISEDTHQNSLIQKLKKASPEEYGMVFVNSGFMVVDRRPLGRLWIFHDKRLNELKYELDAIGIVLVETRNGSASTGGKHSWYLR